MNRDRLLTRAITLVGEMQDNYSAPGKPSLRFANHGLLEKMSDFMEAGVGAVTLCLMTKQSR